MLRKPFFNDNCNSSEEVVAPQSQRDLSKSIDLEPN